MENRQCDVNLSPLRAPDPRFQGSFVLIVPATIQQGFEISHELPRLGWTEGPLSFETSFEHTDTGDEITLTGEKEERKDYFFKSTASFLYGGVETERWSQRRKEVDSGADGLPCGLEIFRYHKDKAFVLVHYNLNSIGGDELICFKQTLVDELKKQSGVGELLAELRGLINLDVSGRTMGVAAAFPEGELTRPLPPEYDAWTEHKQWLRLVAGEQTFSRLPPNTNQDLFEQDYLPLSASWAGMVFRDMVVFLGFDDSFAIPGSHYSRTLYTDAVLLGEVQRALTHEFKEDLISAGCGDTAEDESDLCGSESVPGLERSFSKLRTIIWWTDITPGVHARHLLEKYQKNHRLELKIERLSQELVQAAKRAARDTAEQQNYATEKTNSLLAFLTLVGAPIGLALQLAALFDWTTPTEFAVATVVTFVGVLLLAISPLGKTLRGTTGSKVGEESTESSGRYS